MKWLTVLVCFGVSLGAISSSFGQSVWGIGNEALGQPITSFPAHVDLTDPENDGNPEADENYNAVFRSNDEPGFGGGESAFNVFDNRLGPGNDKWCCGPSGGIPEEGLWVEAEFPAPISLDGFAVSSANDVPSRDPTHWAILGSNDGVNYETIFEQQAESSVWTERQQTRSFANGDDYFVDPEKKYKILRMATYDTAEADNGGAYFQLGEIQFFDFDLSGWDCNFDFVLDGIDVDCRYDLIEQSPFANGVDDLRRLISRTRSLPGDANLDGLVNFSDFVILAENFGFGESDFKARWTQGDFDLNGVVGFSDFQFLATYFGRTPSAASAVPEPATQNLAVVCAAIVLLLRRQPHVSCVLFPRSSLGNRKPR